jgi:hypothetical protein
MIPQDLLAFPAHAVCTSQEYITLDMPAAMREAGFQQPLWKESTPRHKTVVAVKPQ